MTGPDLAHPGSDGAGPTTATRGTAVPSGAAPEPSRAKQGNALRAGVLGSTDGLVSNLSLVLGVAGSGAARGVIVVAGLAGLSWSARSRCWFSSRIPTLLDEPYLSWTIAFIGPSDVAVRGRCRADSTLQVSTAYRL